MMLEHILVRKSDLGEICVFDERDNLLASFQNGKWIADDVFEYSDFDRFTVITDKGEIEKISSEARKALNQPFKQTKDQQSKTA